MRLATIADGSPDGRLVVVSADGSHYLSPTGYSTLQRALEQWTDASGELQQLAARLAGGEGEATTGLHFAAPLPRAWQWLDGSVYESHSQLMQTAFKLPQIEHDKPLMYQGMSHQFYGPHDDVALPREEDGIDFEGEFAVITDAVPMGVSAEQAAQHVRLIVQLNDWSLRTLAPIEMKTGFGWIQAKPACSVAPYAITPEELGSAWRDSRVHLKLRVEWNGELFGHADGGAMSAGFDELIAHAAATRSLCAGTIIGSGTVSNDNFREVGSSCIAERRGIEMVDEGEARTSYMAFGDRVLMEARSDDDEIVFGEINQRVVRQQV